MCKNGKSLWFSYSTPNTVLSTFEQSVAFVSIPAAVSPNDSRKFAQFGMPQTASSTNSCWLSGNEPSNGWHLGTKSLVFYTRQGWTESTGTRGGYSFSLLFFPNFSFQSTNRLTSPSKISNPIGPSVTNSSVFRV